MSEASNPTPLESWCLCGRPYPCKRCDFLDGVHETEAAIIDSLRDARWLSLYEISDEIKICTRQTLRWLNRMIASGRIMKSTWEQSIHAPRDRTSKGMLQDRTVYRLNAGREYR